MQDLTITMTLPILPIILSILMTLQAAIVTLYIIKSYSTDIHGQSQKWYPNQKPHISSLYHEQHGFITHKRTNLLRGNQISDSTEEDMPVLFIAVISGGSFIERRKAIRHTWMKDCSRRKNVVCKFFTDTLNVKGKSLPNATIDKLRQESAENNNDLVLLNTPSGRNFAIRLLSVMDWAEDNFEFDFFLRIDDDHFLCLDRLLYELPFRPRERLYWGHLHCAPGVVRIDEGWVMLTEDLVRTFLKTKSTLQCSRFADQALAMWIYDLMRKKNILWYGDIRIFHHPPAATISEFKIRKELCHTYLSLHGSYPIDMRVFQLIQEREQHFYGHTYDVPPIIDVCPYERNNFNWKWFDPNYYTEPKPCKQNPIWSNGGELFIGRSIDIRYKIMEQKAQENRWRTMHNTTKIQDMAKKI